MKIIFTFFVLILFAYNLSAQPGSLDKTFGDTGLVTKPINFQCSSIKVQNNENILAGGANVNGLAIVRYLKDGNIDYNFGDSGVASAPVNSNAIALAVNKDGAILAAGGYYDVTLIKFTSDGKVDSSFGINGITVSDMAQYEYANDLQLQPDGKIVVSGITYDDPFNPQPHLFIDRFNRNGKIDAGFGINGRVVNSVLTAAVSVARVVLQQDNKIIIGGSAYVGDADLFISRYNADGSPDESFGSNGSKIIRYSNNDDYLNALAIQPDGKIIAAGQGNRFIFNPELSGMLMIRLTGDGSLDKSFGNNGQSFIKLPDKESTIQDILIQTDGKIIGVGYNFYENQYSEFALLKTNSSGIPDSSFGTNGLQQTYYENLNTVGGELQGNKIITAGFSYENLAYHPVLARYNNVVTQSQTPITRIKRWLHKHGITWDDCPPSICGKLTGYAVQRSSNGLNWTTILRSRASANNQQLTSNNYVDPSPLPGANYYRLQTTNIDNVKAYSNVIAINNEPSTISLSPNPAKNVLRIEGLSSSNKTKITVVDLAGNVACSLQLTANSSSCNLNIAALKPGNYWLKVEVNGEMVTKQFVKQ
jgi:uncharacterized delta-60 repeat protein